MKVEAVDEALIDGVCERLREQLPDGEAAQAEAFVRQYYRWASPDDLAERSLLDVYGAALAHLNLARVRRPGEPNVRVYNPQFPQFEVHGWQSTHTAVEVVTDDMPFLTDSVTMELNRHGFGVHLIIHPVMSVRRGGDGRLEEVLPPEEPPPEDATTESVIHAEVDRQTDPRELEAMGGHLNRVIGEVRAAVEDWPQMGDKTLEIATELEEQPPPLEPEEITEAKAFLTWLQDNNFIFLGYRDYDVVDDDGEVRLTSVPESGLGILRQSGGTRSSRGFDRLPPAVRARALESYLSRVGVPALPPAEAHQAEGRRFECSLQGDLAAAFRL